MIQLLVLLSTAAPAQELSILGECLGVVDVDITGLTPDGPVVIASATGAGAFAVPGGRCAGLVLDLDPGTVRVLKTVTAAADGTFSVSPNAGPGVCGARVQAVDVRTCLATNPDTVCEADTDLDGVCDEEDLCTGDDALGDTDGDGICDWAASTLPHATPNADALTIVDVDADGDNDTVTRHLNERLVELCTNDGSGSFTRVALDTNDDKARSIAVRDLDGDLDADLVVGGERRGRTTVYTWAGGAWGSPQVIDVAAGTRNGVAAVDRDGDGLPEVITQDNDIDQLYDHANLGGMSFGPASPLAAGFARADLDSIDANNDGLEDLVVRHFNGLDLFLSNGAGFEAPLELSPSGLLERPVVADLDNDGDEDLITAESGAVLWFENLGGSFAAAATLVPGPNLSLAQTGDLDGDGDIDLIVADTAALTVVWFANAGNAGFPDGAYVIGSFGGTPRTLAVGDLDGDGDPDVAAGTASAVSWFHNP